MAMIGGFWPFALILAGLALALFLSQGMFQPPLPPYDKRKSLLTDAELKATEESE